MRRRNVRLESVSQPVFRPSGTRLCALCFPALTCRAFLCRRFAAGAIEWPTFLADAPLFPWISGLRPRLVSPVYPGGSRLMRFAVAGCDVWRVDFLLRNSRVRLRRRGLKVARIFAGQRDVHELHPDGQSGAGSGLFVAKEFFFVVADPHSA